MYRLECVYWTSSSSGRRRHRGRYAVLASGARLHVDRHEADGAKVRLYHGAGFMEMDATVRSQGFEAEEAVPQVRTGTGAVPAEASGSAVRAAVPAAPQELADAAADKYGLPRELVRSVMAAESGFQPGAFRRRARSG